MAGIVGCTSGTLILYLGLDSSLNLRDIRSSVRVLSPNHKLNVGLSLETDGRQQNFFFATQETPDHEVTFSRHFIEDFSSKLCRKEG